MSAIVLATNSRVTRSHCFLVAERGKSSKPSRIFPSGQIPSRMFMRLWDCALQENAATPNVKEHSKIETSTYIHYFSNKYKVENSNQKRQLATKTRKYREVSGSIHSTTQQLGSLIKEQQSPRQCFAAIPCHYQSSLESHLISGHALDPCKRAIALG